MRDYSKIKGSGNPNYKTGLASSSNKNSLYNSWRGMKSRCLRKTHPKYMRYGGRGITICKEWMDVKNFSEWAYKNGWKQGLSIDRIDNDGNYCPENCRWVSIAENSRKKKTTKIDMETANKIRERKNDNWNDLAKEFGCSRANIWSIINNFTHTKEGECSKIIKLRTSLRAF